MAAQTLALDLSYDSRSLSVAAALCLIVAREDREARVIGQKNTLRQIALAHRPDDVYIAVQHRHRQH